MAKKIIVKPSTSTKKPSTSKTKAPSTKKAPTRATVTTSGKAKSVLKKPTVATPAKVTSDKDTVSSIFEKVQRLASINQLEPRSKDSMRWFQMNLAQMRIQQNQILNDSLLIRANHVRPGFMFQFLYDPKGKEDLPYYDKFPLTIVIGPAEGGFFGLNLHYLHPFLRAKLFDRLLHYTTNQNFDEKTKFRLTYNILNSATKLQAFKPCFKHYLVDHVKSKMVMIPSNQWEIAAFLPTEKFKKQTKKQVWVDTKKQVRGKL